MPDPTPKGSQVVGQLKELWTKQSRGRRMIAVIALLGVVGLVAATQLMHHTDAWQAVADGVSPDDSQELMAALQGRGVPARLREGRVEVETERLDEARAIASSAGLPRTGKGFELFDGANLGQSSFTEQVNYRRALQGELARSIAALAQVESARVHLALGKHSVFKDQEQGPSASVALHMHFGQQLTSEQVHGVRELVAASVEGLKAEAVVIVDNHGNLLESGDPGAQDRKAEIERTVTGRVRMMLERVVGAGKVSVVTAADVDEGKVSETQELYDQEHPALRSETRTLDGSNDVTATATASGVAGTRGNLPGAPAASTGSGSGAAQHLQETKNYELSRTVRQTVKPDIQLQRLHVAVVVDDKVDATGKQVARTEQELAQLTAIARQAAGIDDARGDKIEVRSITFAPDPDNTPAPVAAAPTLIAGLPLVYVEAGAGGLVFLLIVVTLAVMRKRGKRHAPPATLALPAPVAELERALESRAPFAVGAAPPEPAQNLLPGRTLRDRVLDAVKSDVERTAEVLAAWLGEPPKKATKS